MALCFGLSGLVPASGAPGEYDPTFTETVNNLVDAVVVQPDGKILILGAFTQVNGTSKARLARLHPDGTLDRSFQTELSGYIYSGGTRRPELLAVLPDGKILVAGNFSKINACMLGDSPG